MTEQDLPVGVRGYPGMLTLEEAEALGSAAYGKVVLEIGSWCGLSTIIMARGASKVFALDWHGGDAEMGPHDTLMEFLHNLKVNGVNDKVVTLFARCEDMLPVLRDKSFDFIYVDGSHAYEDVFRDAREASRLSRGSIAFHDCDREEVRNAIAGAGLRGLELRAGRLGFVNVAVQPE